MASRDIAKNVTFSASTASYVGQTVECTSCSVMSLTVLLSVSANTLQGNVQLTATNDDLRAYDLSSTLPALTNGVVVTGLPTGITLASTGLLTFNNPDVGTYEVSISYPALLKWARPRYVFTSGGGVVDVRVTLAAWSV